MDAMDRPLEQTKQMNIRPGGPADRDRLLDIWTRSVRATHHFLTEADIQASLPIVQDVVLPNFEELWLICDNDDVAVGFMGLRGRTVDALLVDPSHFRIGAGRRLLEQARRLKGSMVVDVNEQNPQAVAFYAAVGFEVIGRSPEDDDGRPFPLLHMQDVSASVA